MTRGLTFETKLVGGFTSTEGIKSEDAVYIVQKTATVFFKFILFIFLFLVRDKIKSTI